MTVMGKTIHDNPILFPYMWYLFIIQLRGIYIEHVFFNAIILNNYNIGFKIRG